MNSIELVQKDLQEMQTKLAKMDRYLKSIQKMTIWTRFTLDTLPGYIEGKVCPFSLWNGWLMPTINETNLVKLANLVEMGGWSLRINRMYNAEYNRYEWWLHDNEGEDYPISMVLDEEGETWYTFDGWTWEYWD